MNARTRGCLLCIFGFILLPGCAATYRVPETQSQFATRPVAMPAAAVLRAAQRVLIEQGFQIMNVSEEAGVISTAPRDLRVGSDRANCGTTMGIDYLLDNRTATQVAFGIIVRAGELSVRATIQGNYRIGRFDQDITLTCVSKGVLEDELVGRILSSIER